MPRAPSWWHTLWNATPSLPENNPNVGLGKAQAQQELTRDLTSIVLATVAKYSGMPTEELQQSEGLQAWIGQHLQRITHHTPDWFQFVTLIGAKKLHRYLQLPPPVKRSTPLLDPSDHTMEQMPSESSIQIPVDDAVTTTPSSESDAVPLEHDESTNMEPESSSALPHHVTFDIPTVTVTTNEENTTTTTILPDETTTETKNNKRKRTPTPRPPRVLPDSENQNEKPPKKPRAAPKPKPSKVSTEEISQPPRAPRPPRPPRAPRPTKKTPKTPAVTPAADPVATVESPDLLALPEVVVVSS